MPRWGNGEKLLEDPACRSGYEYAKRHDELWRGQSAAGLRMMERVFRGLSRSEGNGNSLGIAIYLRELLASKTGRRKE